MRDDGQEELQVGRHKGGAPNGGATVINYEAVKKWSFDEVRYKFTECDTMLYALAVGFGTDPLNAGELSYMFERNLQSVRTMAAVVGAPGTWWANPQIGADIGGLVHGEQRMRWLRSLPTSGTLLARNRVQSLTDKGVSKGAVGVVTRDVFDAESGELDLPRPSIRGTRCGLSFGARLTAIVFACVRESTRAAWWRWITVLWRSADYESFTLGQPSHG